MSPDYGVFIWSAYGFAALAVLGLTLRAVIDHRMQVRALARLERMAPIAGRAADE